MSKKYDYIKQLTAARGYILADIVIAMLISSIALVAISAMFTKAIQVDALGNHYTIATNLAQKQLELLKTHPATYWADLSLPCSIAWQDDIQLPPTQYTVTTNAALSLSNVHLVEVAVNVCWLEVGSEYKLEFVTLYPNL